MRPLFCFSGIIIPTSSWWSNEGFEILTSGIRQGSGPGPVLFIGGTNSIAVRVTNCEKKFFVDDEDFYREGPADDLAPVVNEINTALSIAVEEANSKGIAVNPGKTEVVLFGTARCLQRVDFGTLPPVIVNGHVIPFSDRCKNLGVVLSSNLAWDGQVAAITGRVNGVLLSLRRGAYDLPFLIRKQLIVSTVLPHLNYVCVALTGLPIRLEVKLAKLQNRAIRFIFHLPRATPTAEYRCRLGWLTVKNRRRQLLAVQVYKVLEDQRPSYLFEKFEAHLAETREGLRLTSARVFDLPVPRSSAFANSFLYQGMSIWNQLPIKLREAPSTQVFKSSMYNFLLSSETWSIISFYPITTFSRLSTNSLFLSKLDEDMRMLQYRNFMSTWFCACSLIATAGRPSTRVRFWLIFICFSC